MSYQLKILVYIDVLVIVGLILFRSALSNRYRFLVSGKLAIIVLTTPMVALLCGNVFIFFLYLTLIVAFNSRSRLELAGVFLFLLPSVPLLSIETGVGGIYLFAFSTVTAMGLGALVGAGVTPARGSSTLFRYDAAVWLLVVVIVFIDTRFGSPTLVLRSLGLQTLLLAAPYLLINRASRNIVEIEQLLLRWTLGATIMAVTACFQASRHWVLYEAYSQALHVPIPLQSAATSLRAGFLQTGGSMVNYSASGLLLAAVITVFPLLRRAFHSFGFWVVLTVLLGGLFATQSRGAWSAAIAGWAVMALWQRRWRRILFIAVGAVFLQVALSVLPATSRLAQLLGKSGHAQETANYRSDLAVRGLAQVRNHPFLGQSTGQLTDNLSDLTQGQHIVDFVNSHLYIAMTAGVPILLVWFAIWMMPAIDGLRQNRKITLYAAPTGIVVSTFVGLIFTSLVDRNMTWLVIALALSASCVLIKRPPRRAIASLPRHTQDTVGDMPFSSTAVTIAASGI